MLDYGLKMCLSLVHNREFRNGVLERLVDIYLTLDEPDYINVCQVRIIRILFEVYFKLFSATFSCRIRRQSPRFCLV